jgi:regulator of protease activity HflC (stomatin/prohibitin superfamily)
MEMHGTSEVNVRAQSGWVMLLVEFVLFGSGVFGVVSGIVHRNWQLAVIGGAALLLMGLLCFGFFTVPPNTARVLLLFGQYKGTVRQAGFRFTNPFMTKLRLSLRAHNLNGEKLKVNDKAGNPIEIAAVVVWRVRNTAQASFDVENYEEFVRVQSETAVRHLASTHPYDGGSDEDPSLRGSADVVASELQHELQARLDRAGVEVVEARLSHLAYAPEIAGAMLRRQQAAAIIAARQRIVEGAVGMVQMALEHLSRHKIVKLDEERTAAMVSNLLVVLCGEQAAQPVLNTGTLYT